MQAERGQVVTQEKDPSAKIDGSHFVEGESAQQGSEEVIVVHRRQFVDRRHIALHDVERFFAHGMVGREAIVEIDALHGINIVHDLGRVEAILDCQRRAEADVDINPFQQHRPLDHQFFVKAFR